MLNTYGDLLEILNDNASYTEKDIWVGNVKEGFKCATDGHRVDKKSEATKYSKQARNKEVLFMGLKLLNEYYKIFYKIRLFI